MAILVDEPIWPAHGRHWAHLVSDESVAELHTFAAALGIPARGFDRDHYDIPSEYVEKALELGATKVGGKELLTRLLAAGLRVRRVRKLKLEIN
ncbi:MAG TPA: DUF4031 domain-containing protein [Candidatus Nanopelagicaceae bacterium]|nr:DUF4031 domain-containing protein [Candidatus Nanopelagicaceae bacterium]